MQTTAPAAPARTNAKASIATQGAALARTTAMPTEEDETRGTGQDLFRKLPAELCQIIADDVSKGIGALDRGPTVVRALRPFLTQSIHQQARAWMETLTRSRLAPPSADHQVELWLRDCAATKALQQSKEEKIAVSIAAPSLLCAILIDDNAHLVAVTAPFLLLIRIPTHNPTRGQGIEGCGLAGAHHPAEAKRSLNGHHGVIVSVATQGFQAHLFHWAFGLRPLRTFTPCASMVFAGEHFLIWGRSNEEFVVVDVRRPHDEPTPLLQRTSRRLGSQWASVSKDTRWCMLQSAMTKGAVYGIGILFYRQKPLNDESTQKESPAFVETACFERICYAHLSGVSPHAMVVDNDGHIDCLHLREDGSFSRERLTHLYQYLPSSTFPCVSPRAENGGFLARDKDQNVWYHFFERHGPQRKPIALCGLGVHCFSPCGTKLLEVEQDPAAAPRATRLFDLSQAFVASVPGPLIPSGARGPAAFSTQGRWLLWIDGAAQMASAPISPPVVLTRLPQNAPAERADIVDASEDLISEAT